MTMDETINEHAGFTMPTNELASTRFLRRTLWVVFVFSLAGVAFSATLSYCELTGGVASCLAVRAPGTIFGLPVCVYGLVMYALLAVLSGFALMQTRLRAETRV
jgi:uncharacterized membrane protein